MKKIALITGAGRGLGWGTAKALAAKDFHVGLLGRDPKALDQRKREIVAAGGTASLFQLDLTDPSSIERAAREVLAAFPNGVHVLVNNAGILIDSSGGYDREKVALTMQTNTLGPLQFTLGIGSVLRKGRANVVNVSSGMGQLCEMNGGYPGYRLSKTALNAVTRYLSQEWPELHVNSVCPGWVKTDMGGAGASRSVEEGVASILWAALLPNEGPTGGFFRDGKEISW
jgi:NAD(P)-dependent dehydrogenase (short-subunit alcohol dehydrogenase family)